MEPSIVCVLCLLIDGGCVGSAPIQRPSAKVLSGDDCPWMRLSITGQDLHVLDCNDPYRGVSMVTVSCPRPFHPISLSLITEPNGNGQLFEEFSLLQLTEHD